jgi:hypothetical protein
LSGRERPDHHLALVRPDPRPYRPERLYLEARWASLVPYAAAAGLLADVLPIASGTNATTLRERVLHVAERAEAELGEERPCFIDGYPAEWAELPVPEGRIVAALDGGDVRTCAKLAAVTEPLFRGLSDRETGATKQ